MPSETSPAAPSHTAVVKRMPSMAGVHHIQSQFASIGKPRNSNVLEDVDREWRNPHDLPDEGLSERGPKHPAKQSEAIRCHCRREEPSSGHVCAC
jgi:hypothetical protein